MEDIITTKDMELIFELTDSLGIDREAINVDLGKEDPGQCSLGSGGMMKKNTIEITILVLYFSCDNNIQTVKTRRIQIILKTLLTCMLRIR